jgi:hypothetical protein
MDLANLPKTIKEQALRIGSTTGSSSVIDEVQRSLQAQAKHEAVLKDHGWTVADRTYLEQGRDALVAALGSREQVTQTRGEAMKTLRELRLEGKEERRDGRAVLALAADDLLLSGDEASATHIEAALDKTSKSGADLDVLAGQLDALAGVAALAPVAKALKARGEDKLAPRLKALAAKLRQGALDAPRLKGAHAESEQINLLDGLLVLKLRRIRDVARRAARKLSSPAIARDFDFAYL